MDVIGGVPVDVTVHRLAAADVRVVCFSDDGHITDVITLAHILDLFAVRKVLGYVGALCLQVEQLLITNCLGVARGSAEVVFRSAFLHLRRIGASALNSAMIVRRRITNSCKRKSTNWREAAFL